MLMIIMVSEFFSSMVDAAANTSIVNLSLWMAPISILLGMFSQWIFEGPVGSSSPIFFKISSCLSNR
ncbi:hypothetical protein D3C81_2281320 [compost metagenome]